MKQRAHSFSVKALDEKTGEFSGYGSVFDVVDSYDEVVAPGAFAMTLRSWSEKGRLPMMLWQHRASEPIGTWTKMVEDDRGLYAEGRILLEAGALEQRAYAHLKAGNVRGLSIGFNVPKGGAVPDTKSGLLVLKTIDLWELSLVSFPANAAAEVDAVKALLDAGPKEFERHLREAAGLTRGEAKGLMKGGYGMLRALREADATEGDEAAITEALNTAITNLRAMRG